MTTMNFKSAAERTRFVSTFQGQLMATEGGPPSQGEGASPPQITQEQIEKAAELARSAVEEAISKLQEAFDGGDREQMLIAVRALEGITKGQAADPPKQEELLDANSRNKMLSSYAGLNNLDRAVTFLTCSFPSFADRPWHEQVFQAGQFCHTGRLPEGCK